MLISDRAGKIPFRRVVIGVFGACQSLVNSKSHAAVSNLRTRRGNNAGKTRSIKIIIGDYF